ncbi:hypothetical protein THRCLA_04951 [Thraustotheca clavata]|uniref:Uncharacterized protein n=1 Tax=Thraustotheca clavata TaxID=74557 RepID=A0A1V9ZXE3_9STRA|nr:hypothetical protein THRCLA_04951 [Thraustotheca clavata]
MSSRDGGGMQHCGCAIGRPCTCGMRQKEIVQEDQDDDLSRYEQVQLAPGVVLQLKKEYEDVPGTRLYKLMRMYRLSLIDSVKKISAVLDFASTHKRYIAAELTEIASRLETLDILSNDVESKHMRNSIQTTMHMQSRYSDLNLGCLKKTISNVSTTPISIHTLRPHLNTLMELVSSTVATNRQELSTCRAFVHNYATTRIQAMARGRIGRKAHLNNLIIFWSCAEAAAAVRIQLLIKRLFSKQLVHKLRQEWWEYHRGIAIHHLQRIARGYIARQYVADLRAKKKLNEHTNAAITLQCWSRCIIAKSRACILRVAFNKRRREKLLNDSAVRIQTCYRGHLSRRALRNLRIERSLSEPVRALAEKYIASGDLWAFLRAIDNNYRSFVNERHDEVDNATTFVRMYLHEKRVLEEKAIQEWHVSRLMESPIVHHHVQTATAYGSKKSSSCGSGNSHENQSLSPLSLPISISPNSPSERAISPIKPVAPPSVFGSNSTEEEFQLGRLAPETVDIPNKYSPKLIRLAMAEGFSLPEVIATLRGLEARGKSIRNVKLLIKELHKRTPLMMNPYQSERCIRTNILPRDRTIVTSKTEEIKPPKSPTKHEPLEDNNNSSWKLETRKFIRQTLPAGIKEVISKFLFVAGIQVYIPPLVDDAGEEVVTANSWIMPQDDKPSPHFIAYLRMSSSLLKVRREQLVTKALASILTTLKANKISHAQDIVTYNVAHLLAWDIPPGLAHSIVKLFKHLHSMTRNLQSKTVVRQLVAKERPSTEDTVIYDTNLSPRLETPVVSAKSQLDNDLGLFHDTKTRLHEQILLPISMDSSIYELLFQALFITLPVNTENQYTSDNLDAFILKLVKMGVQETQRALRKRSQQASVVAREYSNIFRDSCCHVVRDIIYQDLTSFHLPLGLDEQVRILIGRLLFNDTAQIRRSSPQKCLTPISRPKSSSRPNSTSRSRTLLEPIASPLLSRGKIMQQSLTTLGSGQIVNVLDDDILWRANKAS